MDLVALGFIVASLLVAAASLSWVIARERAADECVTLARKAERADCEYTITQLHARNAQLEAHADELDEKLQNRAATLLYAADIWQGRLDALQAMKAEGNTLELRNVVYGADKELTKVFREEPISGVRGRGEERPAVNG